MMTTSIHEGGCICGGVRYRTKAPPQRVSLCSCSWCRKRTGSVLGVSVYFEKADVEFSQGEMRSHRVISDAGRWLESQFCIHCGSSVAWTLEYFPDFRGIAAGTFDESPEWLEPQRYVYARSKPRWLVIEGDIEICETMPGR
ncbi:MAG: GFA family protein [Pseudomonadota bacterium]